jgi:hypothetical protein
MSGLQLTPDEYVTKIAMSKDIFLLLEGSEDKIFFTLIRNKFEQVFLDSHSDDLNLLLKINIETAEEIKGMLGNREKIEKICNLVSQENQNTRDRVLGFVDREFREFEYINSLQDKLGNHRINEGLIWSRGHSIENYFFDLATWKEAFNNYLVSELYQEAFEIFESKFNDILKIACSLSLAALSENLLKPIPTTLDWKCIDITSKSIQINLEE